MLKPIVIMRKCAARVVWRINKNALHLAGKFMFQRLQRQQVVAKDQPVVENVVVRNALFGVIGLIRVFEQDTRLQFGTLFFADPGEF